MAKLPITTCISGGIMALIAAVALIDNLGKYRWFGPYDHDVYGAALIIGLLWYIIFGRQAKAWAEDEQARLDREDEIP